MRTPLCVGGHGELSGTGLGNVLLAGWSANPFSTDLHLLRSGRSAGADGLRVNPRCFTHPPLPLSLHVMLADASWNIVLSHRILEAYEYNRVAYKFVLAAGLFALLPCADTWCKLLSRIFSFLGNYIIVFARKAN